MFQKRLWTQNAFINNNKIRFKYLETTIENVQTELSMQFNLIAFVFRDKNRIE